MGLFWLTKEILKTTEIFTKLYIRMSSLSVCMYILMWCIVYQHTQLYTDNMFCLNGLAALFLEQVRFKLSTYIET